MLEFSTVLPTPSLYLPMHSLQLVGWLEFNVPFQHKYGYIRDEVHSLQKTTKCITTVKVLAGKQY